jgi:hypothetical protein
VEASSLSVTQVTSSWHGTIPADASVLVYRDALHERFAAVVVSADGRALQRFGGALRDLSLLDAAVGDAPGATMFDGISHCSPDQVQGSIGSGGVPCDPTGGGGGPTGHPHGNSNQ